LAALLEERVEKSSRGTKTSFSLLKLSKKVLWTKLTGHKGSFLKENDNLFLCSTGYVFNFISRISSKLIFETLWIRKKKSEEKKNETLF